MSMNESNGIITLMRGDSFSFPVKINIGSAVAPVYKELTDSDVIYFGVMEPGQAFEDAVLKKRIDINCEKTVDGDPLVNINPTDTLKLLVGKYYYMIKLRSLDSSGNETVRTIVKPTLFWLEGSNPVIDTDTKVPETIESIDRIIFDGGEIV